MNGYSKMKPFNSDDTNPQSSMDFSDSDLLSFSQTPIANYEKTSANHTHATPAKAIAKNLKNLDNQSPGELNDIEEADPNAKSGVGGHVKLSRNCSVSSTSSHRFRLNRQSSTRTTIQSAVKRVLSMRRSSSVSERYCRIYDQYVALEPPLDLDDDFEVDGVAENNARSIKKKKSGSGRIFKACKRLLGL